MSYPTRAELDGRLKTLEFERQNVLRQLSKMEAEIEKLKQELSHVSATLKSKPERE